MEMEEGNDVVDGGDDASVVVVGGGRRWRWQWSLAEKVVTMWRWCRSGRSELNLHIYKLLWFNRVWAKKVAAVVAG
nr:hypothetical protein [Tanacetum cinerariifolium]